MSKDAPGQCRDNDAHVKDRESHKPSNMEIEHFKGFPKISLDFKIIQGSNAHGCGNKSKYITSSLRISPHTHEISRGRSSGSIRRSITDSLFPYELSHLIPDILHPRCPKLQYFHYTSNRKKKKMVANTLIYHPALAHWLRFVATTGT